VDQQIDVRERTEVRCRVVEVGGGCSLQDAVLDRTAPEKIAHLEQALLQTKGGPLGIEVELGEVG
jgi:hypothetical protein